MWAASVFNEHAEKLCKYIELMTYFLLVAKTAARIV